MKRILHIPNGICCQGSFCDICALQITLGPTEVTSLYMTQQARLSPQHPISHTPTIHLSPLICKAWITFPQLTEDDDHIIYTQFHIQTRQL